MRSQGDLSGETQDWIEAQQAFEGSLMLTQVSEVCSCTKAGS